MLMFENNTQIKRDLFESYYSDLRNSYQKHLNVLDNELFKGYYIPKVHEELISCIEYNYCILLEKGIDLYDFNNPISCVIYSYFQNALVNLTNYYYWLSTLVSQATYMINRSNSFAILNSRKRKNSEKYITGIGLLDEIKKCFNNIYAYRKMDVTKNFDEILYQYIEDNKNLYIDAYNNYSYNLISNLIESINSTNEAFFNVEYPEIYTSVCLNRLNRK